MDLQYWIFLIASLDIRSFKVRLVSMFNSSLQCLSKFMNTDAKLLHKELKTALDFTVFFKYIVVSLKAKNK